VGVVGLMGLHQVWGKVHAFLFGEPVADKPASITPPLDPALDVPEPPPVPPASKNNVFRNAKNYVSNAIEGTLEECIDGGQWALSQVREAGKRVEKPIEELPKTIIKTLPSELTGPLEKGIWHLPALWISFFLSICENNQNIVVITSALRTCLQNLQPHLTSDQITNLIAQILPNIPTP
jgi:hypothetical protein